MKQINLFKPYMSWRAGFYVLKTLYSGQLAEGPIVKQFEKEFGEKFGQKNVVAVNSGTSALELAYELAGIGKGDEIIVPVLTCTATNLPLVRRGAKIVFADITDSLLIDPVDVENKITNKTKAIVYVNFLGNNTGLKKIQSIARKYKLLVIEDAAQVIGGTGVWGTSDFTCVSLQAIKTLTSGDGGVLITKKESDAIKAKRLRWFGIDREAKQRGEDIDVTEAGHKMHMSDVTGAIGLGNLRSIDKQIEIRRRNAELYILYGVQGYAWAGLAMVDNRPLVIKKLKEAGYGSGMHHERNDRYTIFKQYKSHCPNMDRLNDKFLLLPNHGGVKSGHIKEICSIIKKYESI